MYRRARKTVVSALDTLIGKGGSSEWVGNVQEVWVEVSRWGHSWISHYLIRQVLRDYGESLGRGQYRITTKMLMGESSR